MIDYTDILNEVDTEEPTIITITGDAGVGKTSLGATFPDPIFLRAENGFKVFESLPPAERPKKFPTLSSVDDLWSQLNWLLKAEHDRKTMVLDSVTQLEQMFIEYVIEKDDKKPMSINQANGGYGGGLAAVAAMHGRVRTAARMLMERRGMNVVFIAHSDVTKIDLPDTDPYSSYRLRLSKQSEPHYVDNVDMVAYLRLETFIKKDKTAKTQKAISDGTRVAICHTGPAQVSKNRFGIEEPVIITKGVNPFPFIK